MQVSGKLNHKWVRVGSPDLWTGALGVKKVPGIVSPYSRDEKTPKQAQNGETKHIIPRGLAAGALAP